MTNFDNMEQNFSSYEESWRMCKYGSMAMLAMNC